LFVSRIVFVSHFKEGVVFMAKKKSVLAQRVNELEDAVTRLFTGTPPAPKAKKKKRKAKKAAKAAVKKGAKKAKKAAKKAVKKAKRRAR